MAEQNEQDLHIVANLLKTIDLFKELDEQVHAEIIKHVNLDYFPTEFVIFKEGEIGDKMFIIKTGMVKIYHEGESPSFDTEIAVLGDSDFFGEMALFEEHPRNATAKTLEPTQVFILKKQDFIDLISSNPKVAEIVSKEFLARVKENVREENA
jgi:CRP/FNR family transcriptional regulator, cyclic AMP receptor protein